MNAIPIRARAPGKIILTGEHAVVHGAPALVTAISRGITVAVAPCPVSEISVHSDCFFCTWESSVEVERSAMLVLERYAEFQEGKRGIGTVLKDSSDFVAMCIHLVGPDVREFSSAGISVHIESELVSGSGMGSSAAIATAIVLVLSGLGDHPLNPEQRFALSVEAERFQHGNSSGADPFVAVHGGSFHYRKEEQPRRLDLRLPPLTLVDTGRPESTTGECVASVRPAFCDPGLLASFTEVSCAMERAFYAGTENELVCAIRDNHRLLSRIGVVPTEVTRWIETVEAAGGGAKICGAGSVRGSGAGMVWVVGGMPDSFWAGCPFPRFEVDGGSKGAHLFN